MSAYLLINIFIIIFPLVLSFESKLKFYKNYKHLLMSLAVVSMGFIDRDSFASVRGDWAFSPLYTLGFNLAGLPFEEILFFVTVPYSILFLYETAKYYLKETIVFYNKSVYYVLSGLFVIPAIIFKDNYYTLTISLFMSLTLFLLNTFKTDLLKSKIFWITTAFSYVPFFIVNYLLTSIPIVTYSDNAIIGFRITTIPFEDFFYSFSMISLYIFIYELSKNKWQKK